jgi:hypothetical protein
MSVQIIERNGKPEWAVLPYEAYLQLVEQAEMLEDIRDDDPIKASLALIKDFGFVSVPSYFLGVSMV